MGTPLSVHLSARSQFSFHRSIARIPDLVRISKPAGVLGLADEGNLFGHPELAHECRKADIKPIFGLSVRIIDFPSGLRKVPGASPETTNPERLPRMTLLATSPEGYANLLKLASKQFSQDWSAPLCLTRDTLAQHTTGLIGIDGFFDGSVAFALMSCPERSTAIHWAGRLGTMFGPGRFFLEYSPTLGGLNPLRILFSQIHRRTGIPCIYAPPICMTDPGDAEIVGLWQSLKTYPASPDIPPAPFGSPMPRLLSDTDILKADPEMGAVALRNTRLVADACQAFDPFADLAGLDWDATLPILTPENDLSASDRFQQLASHFSTAGERQRGERQQRLDRELFLIRKLGWAPNFAFCHQLITQARRLGIPIGPGIGRTVGSLVARFLGLSLPDAFEYGVSFDALALPSTPGPAGMVLSFELGTNGAERLLTSFPELIRPARAAWLPEINTLAADQAADLAIRLYDLDLALEAAFVALLGQTVLDEQQATDRQTAIATFLAGKPPKVLAAWRVASRLVGLASRVTHPGPTLAFSSQPFERLFPGDWAPSGERLPIIQLGASSAALLEVPRMRVFQTARTSTRASLFERISRSRGSPLSPVPIDERDPDLWERLGYGIPGLLGANASDWYRPEMVMAMQPAHVEELMNALVSPLLPSPQRESHCTRIAARLATGVLLPGISENPRAAVDELLFDDDLIDLLEKVAGLTFGQMRSILTGLLIRRDYTWDKLQREFADRAARHGIRREKASELLEAIRERFPQTRSKAQAAVEARWLLEEAWAWQHHPREILAVLCASTAPCPESRRRLVSFAQSLGLQMAPVSLNRSGFTTEVTDRGVALGFDSIHGLSRDAIDEIIRSRGTEGPFTSVDEFCARMEQAWTQRGFDPKSLLPPLIEAGAFEEFPPVSNLKVRPSSREERNAALQSLFECGARFCQTHQHFVFMETLSYLDEQDHHSDFLISTVEMHERDRFDLFEQRLESLKRSCPRAPVSGCQCGLLIATQVFDVLTRDGSLFYDQAPPFMRVAATLTRARKEDQNDDLSQHLQIHDEIADCRRKLRLWYGFWLRRTKRPGPAVLGPGSGSDD